MAQKTDRGFASQWWPWFFLAAIFIAFSTAAVTKIKSIGALKKKIAVFKNKMAILDEKTEKLIEDIKASDDPVWLELALMEELGLIPEASIKINYLEEP